MAAPSDNNEVAGCGRLRRPSTQPAFLQEGPGSEISFGTVPEPGDQRVEAGSATSRRYGKSAGAVEVRSAGQRDGS